MRPLTSWFVITLICASSACGSSAPTTSAQDWNSVAEVVADSRDVAHMAGWLNKQAMPPQARWVNLCHRKECSGSALEYTRLFQRAAAISDGVSRLQKFVHEQVASEVLLESNRGMLERTRERLAILRGDLRHMRNIIDSADAGREFAGRASVDAMRGLEIAAEQIDFAMRTANALEATFAQTMGPAPDRTPDLWQSSGGAALARAEPWPTL